MKKPKLSHEDFTSIDIDEVLMRVIQFARVSTSSSAVHWLSSYGLQRLREGKDQTWDWTFGSHDVVGKHMWSEPASDLLQLYKLWRPVADLYADADRGACPPHLLVGTPQRFVYPVFFEKKFMGLLLMDRPRSHNPVELVGQFKAGIDLAARYIFFAYQHLEAKNQTYIDEVTGLHNQRYLPMALEHEIQRTKREKNKFTLLFLDIDYFKLVNDNRGHWVGSKLLLELGKILKDQVRACDYLFRYGGDEFIVILGNADSLSAKIVAERMRHAIESHQFLVEGHSFKLTVSIGLAAYPEHAQSAVGLIQLADQAMYSGKRKSRNIVFVAS